MTPPRAASMPEIEPEHVCDQDERIASLEGGLQELRRGQAETRELIGRPPDPSRGTHGTGMAGTISQIAVDVRELRQRGEWPARLLKTAGMVLAVAVPLAGGLAWAVTHLRLAP